MTQDTIADDFAARHKSISVAEFFEKNRHLLGFDSRIKAMLTCVKEAVDNSLDACEEYADELRKKDKDYELPNILVRIDELGDDLYKVIVEDNGPGIRKDIVPRVFAKLLFGSKFHRLKQGRGQQGIGISASILYGQLTTGKPATIISKTDSKKNAQLFKLLIDIKKNDANIIEQETYEDFRREHGTRVEITIEAMYRSTGEKSVHEYLKRTSIVNPHARITFIDPEGNKQVFDHSVDELPKESKEIKPHPWGIELGILTRMLEETSRNTILSFLTSEFSKMGSVSAKKILKKSKIDTRRKPSTLTIEETKDMLEYMQKVDLQRPPTDCLSPVGREAIEESLKMEYDPEFITATTRDPNVYRGYPFQVEAALAYGGNIPEDSAELLRIANKVPLLYEAGACASTAAASDVGWKRYKVSKPSGARLPKAPLIILVHICSVWVPFTSESKTAIANYPIIVKEIKLALQECARKLRSYLRKRLKAKREKQKINTFKKYTPITAKSVAELTEEKQKKVENLMNKVLEEKFGDLLDKQG